MFKNIDLRTIVLTSFLAINSFTYIQVYSQTPQETVLQEKTKVNATISQEQALNYLTRKQRNSRNLRNLRNSKNQKDEGKLSLDEKIESLATVQKNSKLMVTKEMINSDIKSQKIISYEPVKIEKPVIPLEYFQNWAVNPNNKNKDIGNLFLKQLKLRIKNLEAGIVVEKSNYGLSWRLKTSITASSEDQLARPGISLNYPFPGLGVKKRAIQKAVNEKKIAEDLFSREEVRAINRIEIDYLLLIKEELFQKGLIELKKFYSKQPITKVLEGIKNSSIKGLELEIEDSLSRSKKLRTKLIRESLGNSTYSNDFTTDKTILEYKDLKINETAFLIRAFQKRFVSEQLRLDSLDLDIESASDSYRLKFNFSMDYSKVIGTGFGNDNFPLVAYFSVSVTWDSKAKKAKIMMAKTNEESYALTTKKTIDNVYNSIRTNLEEFYSAKRKVELDYLPEKPITIPNFQKYLDEYGGKIDPNFFSFVQQRFQEDYDRRICEAIDFHLALSRLKEEAVTSRSLEEITVNLKVPEILIDSRVPIINEKDYLKIN